MPKIERVWCESTQVHPYAQYNAMINGYGTCIRCGHHGPVTQSGQLRKHKRAVEKKTSRRGVHLD